MRMSEMPPKHSKPPEKEPKPFEEERRDNEERWENKAKAINKKLREELPHGEGFAIPNEELVTGEDLMLQEALRDHADFEKRQHIEFKEWQKGLRVVISNFVERATNPESKRRTLIFIQGGGMKSANTAGRVIGLNMIGLTADKVDAVGGASGGTVSATEYVAGPEETVKGAAMLTGPLASGEFINTGISRVGETVKLAMVKELLEAGEFKLDEEAIRKSKTELFYVVTLPVQGKNDPEVRFLDAKRLDSMADGIVSSMSIPFATGKIPKINGITYFDGGFAPLPIDQLIEHFNPTDILVLSPDSFETVDNIKPTPAESTIATLAGAASLNQLEKALTLKQQWRRDLERVQKIKNVNIGMMWGIETGITSITTDGPDLDAAVRATAWDTVKQLSDVAKQLKIKLPTKMPRYISKAHKTEGESEELKKAA